MLLPGPPPPRALASTGLGAVRPEDRGRADGRQLGPAAGGWGREAPSPHSCDPQGRGASCGQRARPRPWGCGWAWGAAAGGSAGVACASPPGPRPERRRPRCWEPLCLKPWAGKGNKVPCGSPVPCSPDTAASVRPGPPGRAPEQSPLCLRPARPDSVLARRARSLAGTAPGTAPGVHAVAGGLGFPAERRAL